MVQPAESSLTHKIRRRGKRRQNWRKNCINLAKKLKLADNAAATVTVNCTPIIGVDKVKSTVETVDLSVDKVDLPQLSTTASTSTFVTPKLIRRFSNPVQLWQKTYENLVKWQTMHQLDYWKNKYENVCAENIKLQHKVEKLKAELLVANKNTDEVIELEEETAASSNESEIFIEPEPIPADEKRAQFVKFLKATVAYNNRAKK